VGPPMPDRFGARCRTKKDTPALKVGGVCLGTDISNS